jgi:hydroxylamine dehydrogenase
MNRIKELASSMRLLIVGFVSVIGVLGLALMAMTIGRAATPAEQTQINALVRSNNVCVDCHRDETPGIVEQFGTSTMAVADVACQDCHEVAAGYPGSVEHEDTYVLASPSTAMCNECHEEQVAQFNASRHGLPAYVAMTGTDPLTAEQLALYESIPEGGYQPDKSRNALYSIEGPAVTRFACEVCHSIGRPHPDGSVGQCQKCHLRHTFSLEQARKPETCNACHIGPDHPQWEIYHESPHGIAYATGGDTWNWEAEPGTLSVTDFPAATCAICHISGFGASATTHDVGSRLTWYLFAPVSERRPDWESNRSTMQAVCLECHNSEFVNALYADGDAAVEAVNAWVRQSDEVMVPLQDNGLLTAEPFDEPIDFVYFNLWHHYGRTAKFGTWMQGPDYVQWHGAYEILNEMAELGALAGEKLRAAGIGGQ